VKFPFRRADVEPTPAFPTNVIYRPVIPIWIGWESGPRKPFFGLLDTGADDTVLPLSEAKRLGITLDRSLLVKFRGIGGETNGFYGRVTLELRQSPKSYVWTAQVAFTPDQLNDSPENKAIVSLGHSGFFRYFNTHFDFERGRVNIRPNRLFAGRRG
jgi:Aspartyl protease